MNVKHVDTEIHVNDTEFNEHESNRTYIDKDLDEERPHSDLMAKNINSNSDLLAHSIEKSSAS